jgi:hypothetical protein
MHQDQCIILFGAIFKKVKRNWRTFVNDLRSKSDKEEKYQIFFDDFLIICKNYGVCLSDAQKQNLIMSYPGKDVGNRKKLNI